MHKIKNQWSKLKAWLIETNQNEPKKVRFLIVTTALSFLSIIFLPFAFRYGVTPVGLDFGNPYWFQNCVEHANNPYFVAGKDCGDPLNRKMIYPPTIYWLYIWTRGLTFETAFVIWAVVMVVGIYFSTVGLPLASKKAHHRLLTASFLFQFPFLFAIERGNNDVLVLFAWTLLTLAWTRNWIFLAGVFGALAFMLKLYPAIPLFILGLSFLGTLHFEKKWKRVFLSKELVFCLGFLIGTAVLWYSNKTQNYDYFTKVLPEWMKNRSDRDISIHTIYSAMPGSTLVPLILGGTLVYSWTQISFRMLKNDPVLVFSGLLALSTYFSGISNDYNLITTYPLIAICWYRSFEGEQKDLYFLYFAGSLLGAIGFRWFWKNPIFHLVGLHVVYQVFWLSSFLLLSKRVSKQT